MGKGQQRYVGNLFDMEVKRLQREHQKRTGRVIPYSEVTDRLVFNPPVFVPPSDEKDKKKPKFGFGKVGFL